MPAVWTFTTLTLIATLLHLELFHTDTVLGWAWLVVYASVPLALGAILVVQWRVPGQDPPRTALLPVWFRAALAAQGLIMGLLGVGLFLAPATFDEVWLWPLTPLTARAIGAWLIGLVIVVGQSTYENDLRRVRVPMLGYLL